MDYRGRTSIQPSTTLGPRSSSCARAGNSHVGKDRLKLRKPRGTSYNQLWRIVDGAVADAFHQHPDYINPSVPLRKIRGAIVKRVTGSLSGYVAEATKGRSGESPAAELDAARISGSIVARWRLGLARLWAWAVVTRAHTISRAFSNGGRE